MSANAQTLSCRGEAVVSENETALTKSEHNPANAAGEEVPMCEDATAFLRQGIATGNDDNGKLNGHRLLATVIETSAKDDSLAIEHSLLRDLELAGVVENRRWIYIVLWMPMMVLAAWMAVRMLVYRLRHWGWRKKSAGLKRQERFLLGPEELTRWFDMAHLIGRQVRNGVTTSEALDGVYSAPVVVKEPKTRGERLVRFWLDQPDGQAVRNRLRNAYRALLAELERLYSEGYGHETASAIRILSLACGSAQAVVEAVAAFLERHPEQRVEVRLVDLSRGSLRRAYRLAQARGVVHCLNCVEADLKEFLAAQVQQRQEWDVVEMVGFLDYRPRKSLVRICGLVRQVLKAGGLFVTAHINPSPWSFVVRWVINWPLLVRRTPATFRRLLLKAGFQKEEVRLVTEPHRIHTVAICRRAA